MRSMTDLHMRGIDVVIISIGEYNAAVVVRQNVRESILERITSTNRYGRFLATCLDGFLDLTPLHLQVGGPV
jgi:hypothetical protein